MKIELKIPTMEDKDGEGDKVKVLEPAWVQEERIRIAKNIIKVYAVGN